MLHATFCQNSSLLNCHLTCICTHMLQSEEKCLKKSCEVCFLDFALPLRGSFHNLLQEMFLNFYNNAQKLLACTDMHLHASVLQAICHSPCEDIADTQCRANLTSFVFSFFLKMQDFAHEISYFRYVYKYEHKFNVKF